MLKVFIILVLGIALLPVMPGYYRVVQITGTLGFAALAGISYTEKKYIIAVVFFLLIPFYFPFINLSLPPLYYKVLYLFSALFLVLSFIFKEQPVRPAERI